MYTILLYCRPNFGARTRHICNLNGEIGRVPSRAEMRQTPSVCGRRIHGVRSQAPASPRRTMYGPTLVGLSQTFTRSLSSLYSPSLHLPSEKAANAMRCDAAGRYAHTYIHTCISYIYVHIMLLVAKSSTHPCGSVVIPHHGRGIDRGEMKSTDNATALPRRRLPT